MKSSKFNIRSLLPVVITAFVLLFLSDAFAGRSRSKSSSARRKSRSNASRAGASSRSASRSRSSRTSNRSHTRSSSRSRKNLRTSPRTHIKRSTSRSSRSSAQSNNRRSAIRRTRPSGLSRSLRSRKHPTSSRSYSRNRSSISTGLRSMHSRSSSLSSRNFHNSRSASTRSSLTNRLGLGSTLKGRSDRSSSARNNHSIRSRAGIGNFIGGRRDKKNSDIPSFRSRSPGINREVKVYEGRSKSTGKPIFRDITSSGLTGSIKEQSSQGKVRPTSSDGITTNRPVRVISENRNNSPSESPGRTNSNSPDRNSRINSSVRKNTQAQRKALTGNAESHRFRKPAGSRTRKTTPATGNKSDSLRRQIKMNPKSTLNRLGRKSRTSKQRKTTHSARELRSNSITRNPGGKKISAQRKHRGGKREKNRNVFAGLKKSAGRHKRSISKQLRRHRGGHTKANIFYRERKEVVKNISTHKNVHIYLDRHRKICRRRIRRGFRFIVSYGSGPYLHFRAVYPHYLRRYVFVSLGGYWPCHYRYVRYHWYGSHIYRWYGYHPVACCLGGDTHNYYTYNYYYDDDETDAEDVPLVDYSSFYEFRRNFADETEKPSEPTVADQLFEDAVEAFEKGDYEHSAELFAEAMKLAPDDMILPFAYCQALFAQQKYEQAADVLRSSLQKIEPDKKAVFYPRGLYKDQNILLNQLEKLRKKSELYCFDADLKLLLGYQLLGMGLLDNAEVALRLASLDMKNAPASSILLEILEELKKAEKEQSAGENKE